MLHRKLIGTLAAVAALTMATSAAAFDDAKYPDLKGQWRRTDAGNPLRIGLSVHAQVDISDQSGPVAGAPVTGVMRGNTGEDVSAHVDALVATILAANGARR